MSRLIDAVMLTIEQEFSDLQDAEQVTRVVVRMMVAIVLGAIIGFERERRGAAAGLRTHMLVAMGSALFVLIPLQTGMSVPDLSRVLQGIVSGIGFLGAGAIIKLSHDREIRGLTTAASIWLTAAIGIAAGFGKEATAVLSTFLALAILALSHLVRSRAPRGE